MQHTTLHPYTYLSTGYAQICITEHKSTYNKRIHSMSPEPIPQGKFPTTYFAITQNQKVAVE